MERVIRKYKLGEEPNDLEYWLTKSETERLKALEQMRKEYMELHQIAPVLIKVISKRKLGE